MLRVSREEPDSEATLLLISFLPWIKVYRSITLLSEGVGGYVHGLWY